MKKLLVKYALWVLNRWAPCECGNWANHRYCGGKPKFKLCTQCKQLSDISIRQADGSVKCSRCKALGN